jgi:hypothetical protein
MGKVIFICMRPKPACPKPEAVDGVSAWKRWLAAYLEPCPEFADVIPIRRRRSTGQAPRHGATARETTVDVNPSSVT